MTMKKQNWLELSSIQLGGAICLPVILIGHELTRLLGLGAAISSIILGNALLFSLALISSKMSYESQKTTAENAESYFGQKGKFFFALIIALSLVSWFAIQTQVMSQDLALMLSYNCGIELKKESLSFILAALMVASSFFGLKGVTLLANATLPLMIVTLGLAVWQAALASEKNFTFVLAEDGQGLLSGFSAAGLSLVMAAAISAVVDLPTFFRHAKTKKDGNFAVTLTFLIGIPLVELVGVMLGFWTNATSLTEALLAFDHPLFKLWVGLFILFAGWTTNNTNLYSAKVCLQAVLPGISERQASVYMGGACLILSLCPLLENLSVALDLMGVLIASMGGVVLTAYSLQKFFDVQALHKGHQMLAWLIGTLAGLCNIVFRGFVTEIAIVDAIVVASIFLILVRIKNLNVKNKELIHEV